MPADRKLYTRLLKQNKVKRKDINRKVNLAKREKIIRELVQDYNRQNLSRTTTLKLVRSHGIKIPKTIARDPFEFAGIRRFDEKERQFTRRQIGYIKRLKGTTIPRLDQVYGSRSFYRGEYAYIIKMKIWSHTKKVYYYKTTLVMADKLLSRNQVYRSVARAIETGDFEDEDILFDQSPPLGDIATADIESFEVSGIMKGVR